LYNFGEIGGLTWYYKNKFMLYNKYIKKNGFTLVELLVVISIIGVLATIITVSLVSSRNRARTVAALADIKQIQKALEIYYADHGNYPTASSYEESSGWCNFDQGAFDNNSDGEYFVDFLTKGGYLSQSVNNPPGMRFNYAGEEASPCGCMGPGVQLNYMLTVYDLPQSVPGLTDVDQCDNDAFWNLAGSCTGEKGDHTYCIISVK